MSETQETPEADKRQLHFCNKCDPHLSEMVDYELNAIVFQMARIMLVGHRQNLANRFNYQNKVQKEIGRW